MKVEEYNLRPQGEAPLMEQQQSLYKVVTGSNATVQAELTKLATENWKPILLTSTVNSIVATAQIQITVILERKAAAG